MRRRLTAWQKQFRRVIRRVLSEAGPEADAPTIRARLLRARQTELPWVRDRESLKRWYVEVWAETGRRPGGRPRFTKPAGQGWLF